MSFPLDTVLGAFLLAFPTLFSIVNPIGSALIFREVTADRSRTDRQSLALRVSIYAACVLLVSLWFGGSILAFFGISLGALRVAGGLVVTVSAWGLLRHPEEHDQRKMDHVSSARSSIEDVAFFPLTMPFTTGAGSMAVAVALASQRPASGLGAASFFGGLSIAALTMCALVWIFYRWSDRVVGLLGERGSKIVSRLVAFLLLCVGVQIISTGIASLSLPLLHN